MSRWFRSHWPLVLAMVVLLATMGGLLRISLAENGGRFVYALDDAYIHMAMAKNFAQHGVWGVSPEQFSSSSSSMLWVLLLSSVYVIVGVGELAPYFLNIVFAAALLFVVYRILVRDRPPSAYVFLTLIVIIFATPLTTLIVSGMEHVLQIVFTILFVYLSAEYLAKESEEKVHAPRALYVLAPLMTSVRYEGLFVVFVICCLLALRRRWGPAFRIGLLSLVPIVLYALISVSHGWSWLPNSILLKGRFPRMTSIVAFVNFFDWTIPNFFRSPLPVLYLSLTSLVLLAVGFKRGAGLWNRNQIIVFVFLSVTFLHLQFSDVGWFFRYEAYLVALGVIAVALSLLDVFEDWKQMITSPERVAVLLAVIALFAFFPVRMLTVRAFDAFRESTKAQNDRYFEHIIPAKFLSTYYSRQTIIVNDLGAVAFFTNARILDMYGIGNVEPLRFRQKKNGYVSSDVSQWATRDHAKIAVLQVQWPEVAPRIPLDWIPVGEWEIPRNVVFGDRRIGFFALDTVEAVSLAQHLREYSVLVPGRIHQIQYDRQQ